MAWGRKSAKAADTGGGSASARGGSTAIRRGGTPEPAKPKRGAQLKMAYRLAREQDRRLPLILVGVFLAAMVVPVLLGYVTGSPLLGWLLGIPFALLVALLVFARRAERAAYAQVEGQLGAAAGVLQNMRGAWTVTPGVAATRAQDVVHRVVGRCGIVLVGEGAGARLSTLFVQERKKLARLAPDAPVTDMVVGNEKGQVPLRSLQRKVMALPKTLRPAQVAEIDKRLRALGGVNVPIPKGPLPKNVRLPRNPQAR